MQRKWMILGCLALALLLSGCGGPNQGTDALPTGTPAPSAATAAPARGALYDQVRTVMNAYEKELGIVAEKAPGSIACTIPGDVLEQMARDAQAVGASPVEGRYQFTWRQSGEYTYQATAQDAHDEMDAANAGATPDPNDETPMDSQLMGDYSVTGGGLFDRVRAYDAAANLSSGTAEITDTLNGMVTGHEFFSFALRDGALYFADAVKDLTAGIDGVEESGRYLAAVGVLRADGLEVVEYYIADPGQLPSPSVLDMNDLRASVTTVSRVFAQGEQVQVTP